MSDIKKDDYDEQSDRAERMRDKCRAKKTERSELDGRIWKAAFELAVDVVTMMTEVPKCPHDEKCGETCRDCWMDHFIAKAKNEQRTKEQNER